MSKPRIEPIRVVILGSTGSIGVQALDIIRRNPDRFTVVALCATGANAQALASAAIEFEVEIVGVTRGTCGQDVQMHLFAGVQDRGFSLGERILPELVIGPSAPEQLARLDVDIVLNAIAGAAGLKATLETLAAGNRLALANMSLSLLAGIWSHIWPYRVRSSRLIRSILQSRSACSREKVLKCENLLLLRAGVHFLGRVEIN